MICERCGEKLEERWDFCPYCGKRKFSRTSDEFKDLFRMFEKSIKELIGLGSLGEFPFGKGFMIEVSREDNKPKLSIREFGETMDQTEEKSKIVIPSDAEIAEPEVKIGKDKRKIEIRLPDIKSEKDIAVKKIGDSIELRAISPNKAYFTIIPLPKYLRLINQRFEEGVLTLNFA